MTEKRRIERPALDDLILGVAHGVGSNLPQYERELLVRILADEIDRHVPEPRPPKVFVDYRITIEVPEGEGDETMLALVESEPRIFGWEPLAEAQAPQDEGTDGFWRETFIISSARALLGEGESRAFETSYGKGVRDLAASLLRVTYVRAEELIAGVHPPAV